MKYADLEGIWISQKEQLKVRKKEVVDLENQIGRIRDANKREMDGIKSGYVNQINEVTKQLNRAVDEKDETIR